MKCILASAIILILFVPLFSGMMPSAKAGGSETTIFQDDFEGYAVGTFPSSGGWQLIYNGTGNQYQVITSDFSVSGAKSLQMVGRYTWSAVVEKDFSSSSNLIGYEACLMATPGAWPSVAFCNRDIQQWGRNYGSVSVDAIDGCIYGGTQNLQPCTANTWYKIRVVMDRNARTFNVWIDGQLKGINIPEANNPWEIKSLRFDVGWHEVKNYYDDVKVFETNPPALEIYKVLPAKSVVFHGTDRIDIGVTNKGTEAETFDLIVKVQQLLSISPFIVFPYENWLGNLHVSSLLAGSSNVYTFTWNTLGFRPGAYVINVYATLANAKFLGGGPIYLQDVGYVILVAGYSAGKEDQASIDSACSHAYLTLRDVGFTRDRICYLNPWPQAIETQNDVWKTAKTGNLIDAIENWAGERVNKVEPLFLYVFAHGAISGGVPIQGFTINSFWYGPGWQDDVVYDHDLASWLNNMKTKTGTQLFTICNFCYSGTFMDDLGPIANVAICSSGQGETDKNLALDDGYYVNFFSASFWIAIHEGFSLGKAFNEACKSVKTGVLETKLSAQTPLLDDNNDGVGHTGPVPSGSSPDVDGLYALDVHIGHCAWAFPWVSSSIATQYLEWPPTENITLWAQVENDSSLTHVEACMVPPDFVTPTDDSGFVNNASETFEMVDQTGDGNFTVGVPLLNFTDHASGPCNFTFVIFAEQENNFTAYPCFENVVFTADGQPIADTTPPVIHITRPLDESIVHGMIDVNGTAADDVCLQKCELYVDGNLSQTIGLPNVSSAYFNFTLDTNLLSNGNHTFQTLSYDNSNNTAEELVTILVVNGVHDIASTDVSFGRPIVFGGSSINVTATIVNHGSYSESTNVTVYANSTFIGEAVVNTLNIDGLAVLTFTWNTSGLSYGNYSMSACAEVVSGETSTEDNNCTGCNVIVTISGDINGDFTVDIYDAILLAGAYNSVPTSSNWKANADINGDNIVDIYDAIILANHYNQHYP